MSGEMTCAVIVLVLCCGLVAGGTVSSSKGRIYLIPLAVGMAAIAFTFTIGDEGLIGVFVMCGFSLTFFAGWAFQRATK